MKTRATTMRKPSSTIPERFLMVKDHLNGAIANSFSIAELVISDPTVSTSDASVEILKMARTHFALGQALANIAGVKSEYSLGHS